MKKVIITIILIIAGLQINQQFEQAFKQDVKQPEQKVDTYEVTATMYNAVPSQCDSDPFLTAGMFKINPNKASEQKWIAMSRDMIARWGGKFNYGDLVKIEGAGHKDGVYRVVDTMNKRFTNRIDFLETAGTKHYKFNNVKLSKWKA
jgi:3D (Asp-Asp-Asp) domain-containing protein